ncbi:MAG TPA: hypothetical protein QGH03_01215 [Candidatus Paceibacterota bacterium]|jgi:hypothetical protein|nr:hypothetical protein [Candidatus Paceibacterota bacterium]HJN62836.1 hypothetical protein [Candidatus Paceibacterota bacterium]
MKNNISRLRKNHPNIYSLLIVFAIITSWRGIWGLLDTYDHRLSKLE